MQNMSFQGIHLAISVFFIGNFLQASESFSSHYDGVTGIKKLQRVIDICFTNNINFMIKGAVL